MYETTYHRPSSVDEAAALFAKGKEAKYLAGGHVDPGHEAAPRLAFRRDRSRQDQGIDRRRAIRRRDRDQGSDHPLRRRQQRCREKGDFCAGLSCLADRRSRRAASRHHRRLARQQRSRGRLSGGGAGIGRDRQDQQAHHRGGRVFQRPVLDCARGWRDHHRRLVPGAGQGGIFKIPASGFAFCADRGVRCKNPVGQRSRGRDRRVAKRRHAPTGDRGGLEGELVGGRARWREDFRRRPACRHPRFRSLSRQPRSR